MFKLSFSSNAFTNYTLEESINYLYYLGYDGIEILGDTPHIETQSPNKLGTKIKIQNIKNKIDEYKIRLSNINTNDCKEFINVFGEEPFFTSKKEIFELKLRQLIRNIEIAKYLCCLNISISSGPVSNSKKRWEVLDIFFNNLNVALLYLPDEINLCIELEPGHIVQCLDDYSQVFKNFKNKNLGINLDIGHLYCVGENIENAFEKFSDKIFHIHFEDIKNYKHYHLIPGDGNLPLKNIINFLEKNYNGFLCIELYTYKEDPVKAAYKSKLYFRKEISCPPVADLEYKSIRWRK